MSAPRRAVGTGLWLLLLALGGLWAASALTVSGDLRRFMPAPQTDDQRLLLQQIGEGPGARLLLLALTGGTPDALAERSQALRDALLDAPELVWVGNGDDGLDAVPDRLLDYRYLLSPGPTQGSLDAQPLRQALQQRLQDMASPAAALIAPLVARDPTLETLKLLDAWTPTTEPARHAGVWVAKDQRQALLLAQTRAPGFDPQGQQAALARLRDAHAAVVAELAADAEPGESAAEAQLEISGPGAFAERMAAQTRGEATQLGVLAGVGLLLLLLLAYRSISLPLYAALPLASGAIAGLALTTALFGEIHGITLAFGFTLLGVAQDYPVHLLSQRRPGLENRAAARAIWPTLATGAGSSCLAYLIFLFAGVDALRQLAAFTIAGLAVAAGTTRYALPLVLPTARADAANGWLAGALQRGLLTRRLPRWPALLLAAGCATVFVAGSTPWWDDDLGALTPVPTDLLQRDRALRAELGAPDVRWLLVLRAASDEQVLQRSEALQPALDQLVQQGKLESVDYAARYLPSMQRQRERQALLPAPALLSERLRLALTGLPFKPTAFDGFLAAVEHARQLPPLTPADLAETPLQLRVATLLQADPQAPPERRALGLLTVSGVQQAQALAGWAAAQPDVSLLDMKATAQSLAAAWRVRVLTAMAVAALLLTLVVRVALGRWRRALRVLLPVALGSACVLAALQLLGIPLTLFHLVSLVLAAGLGVDYALFFERAGGAAAEQRRTLHALLICAASTLLVFGLLALSQIPVLRAIGLTVALGVIAHLLLSLWLATSPTAPEGQS